MNDKRLLELNTALGFMTGLHFLGYIHLHTHVLVLKQFSSMSRQGHSMNILYTYFTNHTIHLSIS